MAVRISSRQTGEASKTRPTYSCNDLDSAAETFEAVMSYYVIIPYSYMMRMLYEKEVFLLLVVFGVGTQQMATKMKI